MLKTIIILSFLAIFVFGILPDPAYARSGCCSHHGGVVGCGCGDGTSLSSTCLPYYPQCSNNNYVAPVYTPSPTLKPTPKPTVKPTKKPKAKKKVLKKVVKKIVKKTPKPKNK